MPAMAYHNQTWKKNIHSSHLHQLIIHMVRARVFCLLCIERVNPQPASGSSRVESVWSWCRKVKGRRGRSQVAAEKRWRMSWRWRSGSAGWPPACLGVLGSQSPSVGILLCSTLRIKNFSNVDSCSGHHDLSTNSKGKGVIIDLIIAKDTLCSEQHKYV